MSTINNFMCQHYNIIAKKTEIISINKIDNYYLMITFNFITYIILNCYLAVLKIQDLKRLKFLINMINDSW